MKNFALWVRTIGSRAPWPVGALMLIVGASAHLGWLQGLALYVITGLVSALVMTIPLAAVWAYVPGETSVERRAREVRQAREREELVDAGLMPEQYIYDEFYDEPAEVVDELRLEAAGLTPEQYIATIPAGDLFRQRAGDAARSRRRYIATIPADRRGASTRERSFAREIRIRDRPGPLRP